MKVKSFYKMSSAALLFFGVFVATLFLQISHAQTPNQNQTENQAGGGLRPNAELELESLDQVQEINEHNFKSFELHQAYGQGSEQVERSE